MLLLSSQDILSVFSMKEAIEADKKAFRLHSEGKSIVPLRTNLATEDHSGQCLFMPAYAGDINQAGVKIVSVFPKNQSKGLPVVPATVVLVDGETGTVSAVLEGTSLTQLRTAAISGAATELLANPESDTAALIGTGGQASAQLEALLTVRPIKKVSVFDIDVKRTEEFVKSQIEKIGSKFKVELVAASSSREAVSDADIVTTVTTSKRPVFQANWIKPGTHVNGIGAYTPEMQELPSELLNKAQKIFVDNREAVLSEAGDFLIPINEGSFSENKIDGELGELIMGKVSGRKNYDDITVMKTVGFATLDVVTAYEIYRKAMETGVGQEIVL